MDQQDKTMIVSDRTMVSPAMGADATIIGASVACPICKTENAPTEKYCGECGFLLSSTPVEDAVAPDTARMPRLTDATGREYLLKVGENTIGREATDVLLNDPTVSRRHAMVIIEDGKAFIEDMGSSNGSSASGVRVQPGERIEITDGAELKFGSAFLTFVLPEPAVPGEVIEPSDSPEEAEAPTDEITAEEPISESVEVLEPAPGEDEVAIEVPSTPMNVAKLVSTADPSREFPIMPGPNSVGRRGGNDIVMDTDPYVSGSHAEITADDEGIWLTDVGSTNGTTLNGAKLQPNVRMALKSGDEIVFGQTAVTLECEEAGE